MSKSNKIIAGLGVAAALGVAAMPLAGAFAAVTADEEIVYKINENLSLTVDVTSGAIDPSAETVVANDSTNEEKKNDLKVTTNHAAGYEIVVEDSDNTTALSNGVTGSSTIPAFASASALTSTGWGIAVTAPSTSTGGTVASYTSDFPTYAASNGTYLGPSAHGTQKSVMKSTALTAQITDETTVATYGVKVADGQPAGTYRDTITYTVVGN